MANLLENPLWEAGIYQLEESDPVMGGEEGIDNLQAKQLANRTGWLKQKHEEEAAKTATHGQRLDRHHEALRLFDQALSNHGQTLQTHGETLTQHGDTLAQHGTAIGSNTQKINNLESRATMPVGAIMFFPGSTAPPGYLKMNGATISRAAYADLWAFAQNALAPGNDTANYPGLFGEGDGVTTFKLPDTRGLFPRFWNDGAFGDEDYYRAAGSLQSGKVGYHGHSTTAMQLAINLDVNVGTNGYLEENKADTPGWKVDYGSVGMLESGNAARAWGENRPVNVALLGCIKY